MFWTIVGYVAKGAAAVGGLATLLINSKALSDDIASKKVETDSHKANETAE